MSAEPPQPDAPVVAPVTSEAQSVKVSRAGRNLPAAIGVGLEQRGDALGGLTAPGVSPRAQKLIVGGVAPVQVEEVRAPGGHGG